MDAGIWWLLFAADQARCGTWPLAGGWLEQAQSLVEAVRFIWAEEARWRERQAEETEAAWRRNG